MIATVAAVFGRCRQFCVSLAVGLGVLVLAQPCWGRTGRVSTSQPSPAAGPAGVTAVPFQLEGTRKVTRTVHPPHSVPDFMLLPSKPNSYKFDGHIAFDGQDVKCVFGVVLVGVYKLTGDRYFVLGRDFFVAGSFTWFSVQKDGVSVLTWESTPKELVDLRFHDDRELQRLYRFWAIRQTFKSNGPEAAVAFFNASVKEDPRMLRCEEWQGIPSESVGEFLGGDIKGKPGYATLWDSLVVLLESSQSTDGDVGGVAWALLTIDKKRGRNLILEFHRKIKRMGSVEDCRLDGLVRVLRELGLPISDIFPVPTLPTSTQPSPESTSAGISGVPFRAEGTPKINWGPSSAHPRYDNMPSEERSVLSAKVLYDGQERRLDSCVIPIGLYKAAGNRYWVLGQDIFKKNWFRWHEDQEGRFRVIQWESVPQELGLLTFKEPELTRLYRLYAIEQTLNAKGAEAAVALLAASVSENPRMLLGRNWKVSWTRSALSQLFFRIMKTPAFKSHGESLAAMLQSTKASDDPGEIRELGGQVLFLLKGRGLRILADLYHKAREEKVPDDMRLVGLESMGRDLGESSSAP